jgi:hypothetical protein
VPPTGPQLFNSPVSATAVVVGLGGGPAPTGTVEFYDSIFLVGTRTLSGGVATMTWTSPPVPRGVRLIWAQYLGSPSFAPSNSPRALFTFYVGTPPAETTTTLAASPSPSTLGHPVTFTATVSGTMPEGSEVAFWADNLLLGTAPIALVGGARQAALTTSSLSAGAQLVSASFTSAPGFAASNSNLLLHVINP